MTSANPLRCFKSKGIKWRQQSKYRLPPLKRLHTRRIHLFYQSDRGIKKINVYADARGRVHEVHYVDNDQCFDYKDLWRILDNVAILLIQPNTYLRWFHKTYHNDPNQIAKLSEPILAAHYEALHKCAAKLHGYFFPDPHLTAALDLFKQLLTTSPKANDTKRKAMLNAIALLFETFHQTWFSTL